MKDIVLETLGKANLNLMLNLKEVGQMRRFQNYFNAVIQSLSLTKRSTKLLASIKLTKGALILKTTE
jgi:hypothetical protein